MKDYYYYYDNDYDCFTENYFTSCCYYVITVAIVYCCNCAMLFQYNMKF